MQIHIYAEQGDIAGVAREIANGVDIDSSEEFSQRTPLMCALSSSNAGIDMIQFLCKNGANIHAVEQESQHTLLRSAVQSGNIDKIQFILDAGADINYQTEEGYDVLIDAMHGRDILLEHNLISTLNLLISQGAAINGITSYGETAIKVAANVGRANASKY